MNWKDWFDIVGNILRLVISILSLFLAYWAYERYINNKLLEKQLETVLKLIEVLQEKKLSFKFYLGNSEKNIDICRVEIEQYSEIQFGSYKVLGRDLNFFELVNLPFNSLFKKGCIFQSIKLSINEKNKINEWVNFASDPILPKTIADTLREFRLSEDTFLIGQIGDKHQSPSFVLIGQITDTQSYNDISAFLEENDGEAFKSWRDFIKACDDTSQAIKSWLKKHGITEINL
jgi:hypothetical protein